MSHTSAAPSKDLESVRIGAEDHDTHGRRRLRPASIASYKASTSHMLSHAVCASVHRMAARERGRRDPGMLCSPVGHDLLHRGGRGCSAKI